MQGAGDVVAKAAIDDTDSSEPRMLRRAIRSAPTRPVAANEPCALGLRSGVILKRWIDYISLLANQRPNEGRRFKGVSDLAFACGVTTHILVDPRARHKHSPCRLATASTDWPTPPACFTRGSI
jgi:hypothetical protein